MAKKSRRARRAAQAQLDYTRARLMKEALQAAQAVAHMEADYRAASNAYLTSAAPAIAALGTQAANRWLYGLEAMKGLEQRLLQTKERARALQDTIQMTLERIVDEK